MTFRLPLPALCVAALCLATLTGITTPARANDTIDFREPSCQEFLDAMQTSSKEDVAGMMLWLDGYVNGLSRTPVIDWAGVEKFIDRVVSRCQSNTSTRLIDVVEQSGRRR